jgi:hypothetical protein
MWLQTHQPVTVYGISVELLDDTITEPAQCTMKLSGASDTVQQIFSLGDQFDFRGVGMTLIDAKNVNLGNGSTMALCKFTFQQTGSDDSTQPGNTSTPGECARDTDCDDGNQTTADICIGIPARCVHTTTCISSDGQCPVGCVYPADTDCSECTNARQCNDQNPCTADTCAGTPARCQHSEQIGCALNTTCVPIGTRSSGSYCSINQTMKAQETNDAACDNNYECASNVCVNNKCIRPSVVKRFLDWLSRMFG